MRVGGGGIFPPINLNLKKGIKTSDYQSNVAPWMCLG